MGFHPDRCSEDQKVDCEKLFKAAFSTKEDLREMKSNAQEAEEEKEMKEDEQEAEDFQRSQSRLFEERNFQEPEAQTAERPFLPADVLAFLAQQEMDALFDFMFNPEEIVELYLTFIPKEDL